MSDLYSFFRYTLPGVIFLFETSVAAWLLFPTWFSANIYGSGGPQAKSTNATIGLIVVTFSAGAIGYLLTVAYRAPSFFLIDYSAYIDYLVEKQYLDSRNIFLEWRNLGCIRKRKNAWIIISVLWFERTESSEKIKGAVERTQGLSHLLNSSAAIVIGTGMAILFISIGLFCSSESRSWLKVAAAYGFLSLAFVAQLISCRDAKRTFFEFCKQVLTDALAEEFQEKIQLPTGRRLKRNSKKGKT
jgi:hypothetical protein